jgi:hypothetical protein
MDSFVVSGIPPCTPEPLEFLTIPVFNVPRYPTLCFRFSDKPLVIAVCAYALLWHVRRHRH